MKNDNTVSVRSYLLENRQIIVDVTAKVLYMISWLALFIGIIMICINHGFLWGILSLAIGIPALFFMGRVLIYIYSLLLLILFYILYGVAYNIYTIIATALIITFTTIMLL